MSQTSSNAAWPTLRTYNGEHLRRIALPLGGIGTGTVSLGGRGQLRDFEIVNRPAKGFAPDRAFFALWTRRPDGATVTRALEGPIDAAEYEGAHGSVAQNHGLPRFRECSFETAYPFGQVHLSDPDVPARARLQAFNPFVPGDVESSSFPATVLRWEVTNITEEPLEVAVCATLDNFIGRDGTNGEISDNFNEWRHDDVRGLFLQSAGVDRAAPQWGTMALITTAPDDVDVTSRTTWPALSWNDGLLDFWDDLSADGRLDNPPDAATSDSAPTAPTASLCVSLSLEAGQTRSVTFVLAWHFPNRQSWTSHEKPTGAWLQNGECDLIAPTIGNLYTTRWPDAWAVANDFARRLPELETQTRRFVDAFCASDWPDVVKEAALFNLSTLRSQTCFRTPDGRFWGWEGVHDRYGSCYGSCTHVWNYEQATAFLFGDLARSMRETEFLHATSDNGLMSFRVSLPLDVPSGYGAAADGQMGCLLKLLRDFQLCGDEAWLRELWPKARRALEFCWIAGGWDADCDGVMEGCQHNTMDVEYFGPNPQMQGWYLGALRATEEMTRAMGEHEFAARCRDLFERGSAWTDAHLWNGEYYEHQVRPIDESAIAPGLKLGGGAGDLRDPALQLGAGCLVDQLAGQFMAHVCDLGYLLAPEHVKQTLQSVVRYNFKTDFFGHFNQQRSFVLGDEAGLLMASYPRGRRPRRPFPYASEVMTGFEYTAAIGLLQEGETEAGLRCIEAIRARFDGRKRNPFDEAECGHHYARAMASWAATLALSGFAYSAPNKAMRFSNAGEEARQDFWSNGAAWGTCRQVPNGESIEITLTVMHGALDLRRLEIAGRGVAQWAETQHLAVDESLSVVVSVPDTMLVTQEARV